MIESFADAETEKVFRGEASRKLPPDIQRTARRKLLYLHNAQDLRDLAAPPGNRLEKLSGDRAGQHSIRINDRWRICFVWAGGPGLPAPVAQAQAPTSPPRRGVGRGAGKARKVEIVDYHQ